MYFTEFNFKPKTFKTMAIIFGIIGAIFVLASNYIGSLAIRLALLPVVSFLIVNATAGFKYYGMLKKLSFALSLVGVLIIFIYPNLLVAVGGIAILYFSAIELIQMIKQKKYQNKVKLISLIICIVISIVCILNSDATMDFVIKTIGVILLIIGCLCLYQYINKSKMSSHIPDHKFINNDEEPTIIDVENIKDIDEN